MASVNVEKTNFSRVSCIILDLFTDVMRDLLLSIINPTTTPITLPNNIKLNAAQKLVLSGLQNAGNYKDCDTTLLYILLRNLNRGLVVPSNNWGKPVKCNDVTVGDDVERLRCLRNDVYGHAHSAQLNINDYTNFLLEANDILTRFDTCHGG